MNEQAAELCQVSQPPPAEVRYGLLDELEKALSERILSAEPRLQPDRKGLCSPQGHLHKAGERTVSGLLSLIGKLVDLFEPQECANYFSSCGYNPD